MNNSHNFTSIACKVTTVVALLLTLSACSEEFNPKTSQVQNDDAYLTTATAASSSFVAPATTSSLTTGLYSPQAVTLTCVDASGGECLATYYTIDGTTPSRASTVYAGPIALWSKTTLKYFSIDKAGNVEPVKTQNFLIGSIAIQGIKTVAAGRNHTLGLKNDGTLWTWGGNGSGQLGDGGGSDQTRPVQVGTETTWSAIAAGNAYSLALRSDGTLWAWGSNSNGQLGDGSNVDHATPVQVGTEANWSAIAAGHAFALALKTDGTLWTWGANSSGQLGNNTTLDSWVPVQVGTGTDWTAVAAGYNHSVALRNDGTLWTWGGNNCGQLGQDTTTDSLVPVRVPGTNWTAVAAGGSDLLYYYGIESVARKGGHTVAVKSDGTLWAWGENIFGQLGDGTNYNMAWAGAGTYPLNGNEATDRLLPFQIGTDSDWATVAAGAGHTVALKGDGTLWAWGLNVNGQLANGNPGMNNLLPLPVGADTYVPFILPKHPWLSISAGGYQTLALRNDGTLWAWGWNGSGQLGDGTIISTGGGSDPVTATWKIPKYVYVLADKIYTYTIDYDSGSGSGPGTGSGTLTRTASPSVAAGAPVSAALDPAGQFLYVLDSTAATVAGETVSYIHAFSIDRASGGLTAIDDDPAGVKTLYAPSSITVDPLGKFVYVVGTHAKGWKSIAVYTIDPATGKLTCIGTTAQGAKAMVVEPLGRFAYVLKDNGVTGYSIDQRTGMLNSLITPCAYDQCDDNEDDAEVFLEGSKYLKVDLSGQYLYVGRSYYPYINSSYCITEIRVYKINQTSGRFFDTQNPKTEPVLSEMIISPPAKSTLTGIGVNAHTQFMYMLFNNSLYGRVLNQLTGEITGVGTELATGAVGAVTEPTGKYIFVFTGNQLNGYSIDPKSGKTQINGAPTQTAITGVKSVLFASY